MEARVDEVDPLDAAMETLRAFHADQGAVSGRGLEAIIAGATVAVSRKVWLLPGWRERGCAILRGCAPDRVDEARPYRVVPVGPSPANRAAVAVGLALAGDPAIVFCGTGTVSYGAFFEALNLAALRRAPVTFVVAWYTNPGPFAAQIAGSPAAVASGFGLATRVVDGDDAEAVRAAVAAGPGLVEARVRGRE